jgi:hypothetical protein
MTHSVSVLTIAPQASLVYKERGNVRTAQEVIFSLIVNEVPANFAQTLCIQTIKELNSATIAHTV